MVVEGRTPPSPQSDRCLFNGRGQLGTNYGEQEAQIPFTGCAGRSNPRFTNRSDASRPVTPCCRKKVFTTRRTHEQDTHKTISIFSFDYGRITYYYIGYATR